MDPPTGEAQTSNMQRSAAALPVGNWTPEGATSLPGGIGLLVMEGLLLRRVGIDGRFGAELLGEGDLLRPGQGDGFAPTLTRTTGWRVLEATRVAVLDGHAERRFAAFPALVGRLVGRALDRSRNLSVNMRPSGYGWLLAGDPPGELLELDGVTLDNGTSSSLRLPCGRIVRGRRP